jgi:hypothetical protein
MTTYQTFPGIQHGVKERSTLCLPPFALLGAIRKGRDFRCNNIYFVIGMFPEANTATR